MGIYGYFSAFWPKKKVNLMVPTQNIFHYKAAQIYQYGVISHSKVKKNYFIEECANELLLLNCLTKACNLAGFKIKFAVQYLVKIIKGILHLQIF